MDIAASIVNEVRAALASAAAIADDGEEPGRVHAARSRNFVGALAARLREAYRSEPDVSVLSKHFTDNRARFGLNELLFDILVCRSREVPAASSAQTLTVVTQGVLAVESEFAKSSREAIYDFNKLVLCSAERKLFIGPRVFDEPAFLRVLGTAASHCTGEVLAVLLPHPSEWREPGALEAVVGYRWGVGRWLALGANVELTAIQA